MLFFSEGYPTLRDMMEVNQEFEAQYDDEKYEKKIQKLSRRAFVRDEKESPENIQFWREAIAVLNKEDHYILVMLDVPRSAADLSKLILAGLVLTAMLMGAITAFHWADQHVRFRIPDSVDFLILILVLALAYLFTYSVKARKKVGNYLADLMDLVARWF